MPEETPDGDTVPIGPIPEVFLGLGKEDDMRRVKSILVLLAISVLFVAAVCEPGEPAATTATTATTTAATPTPLPAELVQVPEGECINFLLADGREIAICGWDIQQGVRWYKGEVAGEGPVRVSEHWLCGHSRWPRSPGLVYAGAVAQAVTVLSLLGALVVFYGVIRVVRAIRVRALRE